jgi:hypothetical protein
MELKIQADLSIVQRCACGWIFFNVGFRLRSLGFAFSYDPTRRTTPRQVNGVIGIDYVIIRAGR